MYCRGIPGAGYGHFGGFGGGMFIMMGFGFLIFLVLIYLAIKLLKSHAPMHKLVQGNSTLGNSTLSNSALSILNERFAKGEIDEEEYTKKKTLLNQ